MLDPPWTVAAAASKRIFDESNYADSFSCCRPVTASPGRTRQVVKLLSRCTVGAAAIGIARGLGCCSLIPNAGPRDVPCFY